MRTTKPLLLLLASALILAACSGAASPKAATSSVPASTTAAAAATTPASAAPTSANAASSTAPAAWSIAEAQQQLTTMVAASNVNVNKLKALPDSAPLSEDTALCTKIAADIDTLVRSLTAGHWPAAVQPQIAAYEPVLLTLRQDFITMSRDTDLASFNRDIQTTATDNGKEQAASEAVRIALGMPPN